MQSGCEIQTSIHESCHDWLEDHGFMLMAMSFTFLILDCLNSEAK